ncbi:MAG: aldehyde dehydrogenase family protein, partial [Planctomycetota bacterium]|nr:aldehyde dehydrogenase family protein [Planctomycetota bacterium]
VEGPRTDALLNRLLAAVDQIRIGASTERPEPFMGPVVSPEVAERLMRTQDQLCEVGGQALISMGQNRRFPSLLSPGLIDVTGILDVPDEEWFGPLLQVLRVPDFDEAINAANSTKYGLSAGLLSDSRERYDQFRFEVKAGIINWNRPTTGASGALPFGGVGKSGNHRPSGYFAIDFCSDPVASLESTKLSLPENLPPGILEL